MAFDPKQKPDWKLERSFGGFVCGLDEVGRAPLAGPVVSACAYVPEENRRKRFWSKVNDSKQLTRQQREALYDDIRTYAHVSIGQASVTEIDDVNIYHASLLSMQRAFEALRAEHGVCANVALVDGNAAPNIGCVTQTVIKGDATSLSIAAASIVAKVWRDCLMMRLHEETPWYGWLTNAGYPTREHLEGIEAKGVTDHHRRSFAPVRNYVEFGTVHIQRELNLSLGV